MKSDRWTEDLYLYRIKPAPPKVDDFQEYIALYLAEKDEKYLGWFLHYYEPRLNTVIMQMVQETAMQGHFADLKQAYIFGICKALQKYDISTGVPFLIFKEFYVKNEIDNYIRTMRQGYSVLSVDEYRTLKNSSGTSWSKSYFDSLQAPSSTRPPINNIVLIFIKLCY